MFYKLMNLLHVGREQHLSLCGIHHLGLLLLTRESLLGLTQWEVYVGKISTMILTNRWPQTMSYCFCWVFTMVITLLFHVHLGNDILSPQNPPTPLRVLVPQRRKAFWDFSSSTAGNQRWETLALTSAVEVLNLTPHKQWEISHNIYKGFINTQDIP